MSAEDLKKRLHARQLAICEEAILRITALENSVKFDMDLFIAQKQRIAELEKLVAELENEAMNLNNVLNDYTDRESERQNDD